MDPDKAPESGVVKCLYCGSSCSALELDTSPSGTYFRSVKRKFDEFVEKSGFSDPGYARIDAEDECGVLREMVASQQQTIQDLAAELEEERNASASATDEAMSMILRLQREKAEIEMEARQFKRFAEERMEHDQQEILALEDLLYTREQTIESLLRKVKLCKWRLTSYGLTEADPEADGSDIEKTMSRSTSLSKNLEGQHEFSQDVYPRLMCNTHEPLISFDDGDKEAGDAQKYEDSPQEDQLKDLEHRIYQLERSPRTTRPDNGNSGLKNAPDMFVVGQTPHSPTHLRNLSTDSICTPSIIVEEIVADFPSRSPELDSSLRKVETENLDMKSNKKGMYNATEVGDDMNDRVYTIDSIHQGASSGSMNLKTVGDVSGEHMTTSMGSGVHDLEIQKLYARLQALEADRETMRHTIISMGTDKAQLVLLREIAQNLCKDMSSSNRGMQSKKQTTFRWTTYVSLFKAMWIASFLICRSKAHRCRYMFGAPDNCVGLQMILDRGSCTKHSMLLSRTSV